MIISSTPVQAGVLSFLFVFHFLFSLSIAIFTRSPFANIMWTNSLRLVFIFHFITGATATDASCVYVEQTSFQFYQREKFACEPEQKVQEREKKREKEWNEHRQIQYFARQFFLAVAEILRLFFTRGVFSRVCAVLVLLRWCKVCICASTMLSCCCWCCCATLSLKSNSHVEQETSSEKAVNILKSFSSCCCCRHRRHHHHHLTFSVVWTVRGASNDRHEQKHFSQARFFLTFSFRFFFLKNSCNKPYQYMYWYESTSMCYIVNRSQVECSSL